MKKKIMMGILSLSVILSCGCNTSTADTKKEQATEEQTTVSALEGSSEELGLVTIDDEPVPVTDGIENETMVILEDETISFGLPVIEETESLEETEASE